MPQPFFSRRALRATAVLAVGAAALVVGQRAYASDHQDTPEVELSPRMDINDVYAFPGATADRVALVLTTSSPIAGQTASFDPNLLYQLKVDNTGDAVEDLVFQVTFDDGVGAAQRYTVRGPRGAGDGWHEDDARHHRPDRHRHRRQWGQAARRACRPLPVCVPIRS